MIVYSGGFNNNRLIADYSVEEKDFKEIIRREISTSVNS